MAFLTKVLSQSMFGSGLAREKSVTFQHLEKPNVFSFMPRRDISSMKLKCEGGEGVKVERLSTPTMRISLSLSLNV
ncbi:hypothetical protein DY000_02054009 [Brassica cretica]|uniref:Uncharacterized protein n=1 Tax=Brassica cretica TaxID=69181 RepID=A0ABQ7AFQ7_BRACR|nr:hypothetical protein DY000_02054009 [Brassica cretica]